jgi:hypothetical protein
MWDIKNHTPYKVDSTWARDQDGVHQWIVAVKATYHLTASGPVLLDEGQLEPLVMAEYNGDAGLSSLRYDADLLGAKPTTDVIVNGSAYAPAGRPSADFMVAMKVGVIQKSLRVRGPRRWGDGLFGLSSAEPVLQVPIVYERAYGGYDSTGPDPRQHRIDLRNPVGCGVVADDSRREGQLMPNFEYPDGRLDRAGPAGFGAIDVYWSPRREFAGTYDAEWQRNRLPLLPHDWDPRSLQCAPPDQRPEQHLRGGEVVELTNLTPAGTVSFMLPKVRLGFSTLIDTRTEEHRAHLSTVVIEPDAARLIMVWVTSLPCRSDIDYLEYTIVREKVSIQ